MQKLGKRKSLEPFEFYDLPTLSRLNCPPGSTTRTLSAISATSTSALYMKFEQSFSLIILFNHLHVSDEEPSRSE